MIRTYTVKDADYIIHSHYDQYHKEFQYDESFRNFIATSVQGFIERGHKRENIWIVELEGKQYGSISIKNVNDKTAQLGLFLIEQKVRGAGYGQQLIKIAIDYCKEMGYETIILWTNRELITARRLYEKNGFQLIESRARFLSNKKLIEECWELNLEGKRGN
ncbi:GNAT family N-acetyltransferase [Bacillus spongiae]|uniref:GNAT family N-acetyltransferase n=1 Tax=Bacillus spongiae TaxID=2683610 RepID=A0ABU8HCG8_9BACI